MSDQATRILVLHGPNLNLLGRREPDIYGHQTLADIDGMLEAAAKELGVAIVTFQSNHEGAMIDKIHEWADEGLSGLILNPGGFTHTSVALRDAVVASGLKTVEVHLSNIHAREDFRHKSLISGIASAVIAGMGYTGYIAALRFLSEES